MANPTPWFRLDTLVAGRPVHMLSRNLVADVLIPLARVCSMGHQFHWMTTVAQHRALSYLEDVSGPEAYRKPTHGVFARNRYYESIRCNS